MKKGVNLAERTICAARDKTNDIRGVMLGRTANVVSPTRPRVTLWTADASTGSLRYGAATLSVSTLFHSRSTKMAYRKSAHGR